MSKEILILSLSWVIALYVLLMYIPKESRRLAHISFLFSQSIAWVIEYIQVLLGLVEFPTREFSQATNMSFSLHYIVYPTFGVFFILLYPKDKGNPRMMIHYLLFSMAISTYSVFVEKYSTLFEFHHWGWLIGVIMNLFLLYIVKKFTFWFGKGLS